MSPLISEKMLRYLYNEMSAEESMVFLKFINSSPAAKEQFNQMKEGFETLNGISLNPSRNTVDRILSYGSIDGFSMQ
jgi:hypothetical protein